MWPRSRAEIWDLPGNLPGEEYEHDFNKKAVSEHSGMGWLEIFRWMDFVRWIPSQRFSLFAFLSDEICMKRRCPFSYTSWNIGKWFHWEMYGMAPPILWPCLIRSQPVPEIHSQTEARFVASAAGILRASAHDERTPAVLRIGCPPDLRDLSS